MASAPSAAALVDHAVAPEAAVTNLHETSVNRALVSVLDAARIVDDVHDADDAAAAAPAAEAEAAAAAAVTAAAQLPDGVNPPSETLAAAVPSASQSRKPVPATSNAGRISISSPSAETPQPAAPAATGLAGVSPGRSQRLTAVDAEPRAHMSPSKTLAAASALGAVVASSSSSQRLAHRAVLAEGSSTAVAAALSEARVPQSQRHAAERSTTATFASPVVADLGAPNAAAVISDQFHHAGASPSLPPSAQLVTTSFMGTTQIVPADESAGDRGVDRNDDGHMANDDDGDENMEGIAVDEGDDADVSVDHFVPTRKQGKRRDHQESTERQRRKAPRLSEAKLLVEVAPTARATPTLSLQALAQIAAVLRPHVRCTIGCNVPPHIPSTATSAVSNSTATATTVPDGYAVALKCCGAVACSSCLIDAVISMLMPTKGATKAKTASITTCERCGGVALSADWVRQRAAVLTGEMTAGTTPAAARSALLRARPRPAGDDWLATLTEALAAKVAAEAGSALPLHVSAMLVAHAIATAPSTDESA